MYAWTWEGGWGEGPPGAPGATGGTHARRRQPRRRGAPGRTTADDNASAGRGRVTACASGCGGGGGPAPAAGARLRPGGGAAGRAAERQEERAGGRAGDARRGLQRLHLLPRLMRSLHSRCAPLPTRVARSVRRVRCTSCSGGSTSASASGGRDGGAALFALGVGLPQLARREAAFAEDAVAAGACAHASDQAPSDRRGAAVHPHGLAGGEGVGLEAGGVFEPVGGHLEAGEGVAEARVGAGEVVVVREEHARGDSTVRPPSARASSAALRWTT